MGSSVRQQTKRAAPRGFWPREHGAYVQLLAPLSSALLFAPPSAAALGCAALACALFLAHEPLLVVLGLRGERCRAAYGHAARTQLLIRLAAASLIGLGLALFAPHAVLRTLLIPAVLAAAMLVPILRGREKSLPAELLAAAALTSLSLPVLVAHGLALEPLAIIVGAWLAAQILATLTARAYVYRRRNGEAPLTVATFGALLVLGAAALLAAFGRLPLLACLTLVPFVLVAIALRSRLYRPRTPKGLGWALAVANLIAVVLLGTALSQST